MLWSLGKKSILKCCLPTIARFWQPLRYIHVTSTYKNILFDERKSDDFNKLIWRIPASPNTDRFLWRWFHRKAQDPTKATNWNNHNVHKNYMKWLVQSNLQVILVIQWMYHYNLGRMTRNPTRRKTSSKVSYEPLLSHIGITKLLRVPLQLPLGSTGSEEGWSMSIHKVWSWIFHHRTSGWSTKSGHQPEVLVNIFPSILLGFSDSLYFSITPRWGSLGSQVLKIHHFPEKNIASTSESLIHPAPKIPCALPSPFVTSIIMRFRSSLKSFTPQVIEKTTGNHKEEADESLQLLENDQNPTSRYEKLIKIGFCLLWWCFKLHTRMCNLQSKSIKMHQDAYSKNYDVYCIVITTSCNSSTYCKHQNQKTYTWLEGPLALAQLIIVETNLSRLDPSWKRTTTLFSKHSNVRWTIWRYMKYVITFMYFLLKNWGFSIAILVDFRASLPNPKHHVKGTPQLSTRAVGSSDLNGTAIELRGWVVREWDHKTELLIVVKGKRSNVWVKSFSYTGPVFGPLSYISHMCISYIQCMSSDICSTNSKNPGSLFGGGFP